MQLESVRKHYADKLMAHGHTPQGVDWKDDAAQMDRLNALCLLFGRDEGYTLNDWGCGYGQLAKMTKHSRYYGYDLVDHGDDFDSGSFRVSAVPTVQADYTVASGIFNVTNGRDDWDLHVIESIKIMERMSIKGFGFNMLHARADRKQPGLFYASPEWVRHWLPDCNRVSILQHYSNWDFTVLVHLC